MDFFESDDKALDTYTQTLVRHREICLDFKRKTIKINPSIEIRQQIYNYKNIF